MKNLCAKLTIFIFTLCVWTNTSYAQSFATQPHTKIDGALAIVNVWQADDSSSGLSKIQGTYDNSTVVDLTSISDVHAVAPILASSRSLTAVTRAVAVWKAFDINTFNFVIQTTTATTPLIGADGWVNSVVDLSSNDGSEVPLDDYKLDISDDGQSINVIWSAYMTSSGDTVIRINSSSNGGASWSGPTSLTP